MNFCPFPYAQLERIQTGHALAQFVRPNPNRGTVPA